MSTIPIKFEADYRARISLRVKHFCEWKSILNFHASRILRPGVLIIRFFGFILDEAKYHTCPRHCSLRCVYSGGLWHFNSGMSPDFFVYRRKNFKSRGLYTQRDVGENQNWRENAKCTLHFVGSGLERADRKIEFRRVRDQRGVTEGDA